MRREQPEAPRVGGGIGWRSRRRWTFVALWPCLPATLGFLAPSRAISRPQFERWVCRASLATLGVGRRGGGRRRSRIVARWQAMTLSVAPNRAQARRWATVLLALLLLVLTLPARVARGQPEEDLAGA